jgi:hypothetical protein
MFLLSLCGIALVATKHSWIPLRYTSLQKKEGGAGAGSIWVGNEDNDLPLDIEDESMVQIDQADREDEEYMSLEGSTG